MREKLRVVVADDHPLFRGVMTDLLAEEFEVVDVVCNGLDLLAAVVDLDPDIIVSDVSMPVLDGVEAVKQMRERGVHTPAVITSLDGENAARVAELGAAVFVDKCNLARELQQAVSMVACAAQSATPGC